MENLWKWRSYLLVRDISFYKRRISICRCGSLSVPGRQGWLNLSKLLSVEKATDLNLHNTFINVYWALLDLFPRGFPPDPLSQPFFFFLSLAGDGISGGDLGHLREVRSFHRYLPCIQELYMVLNLCLFFFCYSVFYYQKVSGRTSKGGECQLRLSLTIWF